MKQMMKVALFFACMICLTSARTNITSSLNYDCTKNDTIRIYSQNLTAHGSIYATSDDNIQCNVSKSSSNNVPVVFEIRGCNMNKTVKVIIMSDKQGMYNDMVLGGRHFEMHELQCNGVLAGGVKIHQSITLNETEKLPPSFTPHPQAYHNLTMEIRKQNDTQLLTSATVRIGDQLRLIITVSTGFKAFVESCKASDKIVNGSHTLNLSSKGQSNDPDVLSNFTISNISGKFAIEAQLYAFHFIGTYVVTIDCDITVCESDDKACSFNVSQSFRRRRRNTALMEQTMTRTTTLRVVDRPLEKDDNWETSNAKGGSEYGFFLMIFCAVISATRTRLLNAVVFQIIF